MAIDVSTERADSSGDATDVASEPAASSGTDAVGAGFELSELLGEEEADAERVPLSVNLGGEGELEGPGVVNLNLFWVKTTDEEGKTVETPTTRKRLEDLPTSDQRFVQGDMARIPLADDTVGLVYGVRTPFQGGQWAESVAGESYRVLVPGGQVKLHSSNLGGEGWLPYLADAGFGQLGIERGFATGVKEAPSEDQ